MQRNHDPAATTMPSPKLSLVKRCFAPASISPAASIAAIESDATNASAIGHSPYASEVMIGSSYSALSTRITRPV